MIFYPHGPFEIPRQDNGLVAKAELDSFWDTVNNKIDGLAPSIGCYIFSIRAGKGILPWYVGLAEKQSFRNECFRDHKLVHYNNVLADRKKGTPLLTLIAKYNAKDYLVKPTGNTHRDIRFLEKILIANCLSRNASLFNIRDTKLIKEMVVYGLLNTPQGKTAQSISDFKNLIGI